MADTDIPFLSTFNRINIYEMAAIFQFFYNGSHADIPFPSTLRKLETKLWGVSNLKFFCMIDINKIAAIFQYVHNSQH